VTLTSEYLLAVDDRDMKPNTSGVGSTIKGVKPFFTTLGGMTSTADSDYQDVLVLDTYYDTSGGNANALSFDKSTQLIRHWQAGQTATSWGTSKTLAYTDSNISGFNNDSNYLTSTDISGSDLILGDLKIDTQRSQDGSAARAFIYTTSASGGAKFKVFKNTNTTDGYARFKLDRAYDYGNSDQMVQEAIYQRRTTTKNVKFRYDGDVVTTDDVFLEFYELSDGTVEAWLCHDDYAKSFITIYYDDNLAETYPQPSAGTPTGTLIHTTDPDTATPNWDISIGAGTFSGNVGIGTTSPDSLLHVNAASEPQVRIENSDTSLTEGQVVGGLLFEQNDSTSGGAGISGRVQMRASRRPDNNGYFGTVADMDFLVSNASNGAASDNATKTAMSIRAGTGNIGIGTITPGASLEVVGNISASLAITASAFVGDGSALTGIDAGGFGYSNPISMSADTSTTAGNYTSIYGPMQINSGVTFTVAATSLVKVETF
jgi:hypothetical protein